MGCLNSKESDLDQRMTSVAGGGAPAPRKTTGGGGLKKGKTDWGEMNAGVDNLKETVTAAVGDWTAPLPEGDDIPFASQGAPYLCARVCAQRVPSVPAERDAHARRRHDARHKRQPGGPAGWQEGVSLRTCRAPAAVAPSCRGARSSARVKCGRVCCG